MLKNNKVVLFCHLKELVRPESFGPYYVSLVVPDDGLIQSETCRASNRK